MPDSAGHSSIESRPFAAPRSFGRTSRCPSPEELGCLLDLAKQDGYPFSAYCPERLRRTGLTPWSACRAQPIMAWSEVRPPLRRETLRASDEPADDSWLARVGHARLGQFGADRLQRGCRGIDDTMLPHRDRSSDPMCIKLIRTGRRHPLTGAKGRVFGSSHNCDELPSGEPTRRDSDLAAHDTPTWPLRSDVVR